ncbi:hypothetical protein [Nostoc sp.]|uniref:hypothetical protein n=1 Tax=Nostoc sp. TaxID=1180 RepID=UPI002FFA10B9
MTMIGAMSTQGIIPAMTFTGGTNASAFQTYSLKFWFQVSVQAQLLLWITSVLITHIPHFKSSIKRYRIILGYT